ncbi:MAG: ABC transporter permease [Bacteroidetes bacterium]|nr:ABC transporter permease [Bacteroidota bacterium]
MIFKIAWRNIWRSRTRSIVVILAVMIGIWAVIFMLSFSNGMIESYIDNAIENQISHIQLHNPDFKKDQESQYFIENASGLEDDLRSQVEVESATVRSLATGMLTTSKGQRGVQIRGVQPTSEASVTKLDQKLVEGEYFDPETDNRILVGKSLSEELNLKIRSKVVLAFQSLDGEIIYAAFRVIGMYETDNNAYDESNVFVTQQDLNRLLGKENIGHEAAILLHSLDEIDPVQSRLTESRPDLLVENYAEISPEIELFNTQMQMSSTIIIVIVMLALIFGIINTMLMAVLERYKELGMLMAVGMNKVRVFFMIVLETLMLGLIALPLGMGLGYGTVSYLSKYGLDLSTYSEGMQEFGMSEIVYPTVNSGLYIQLGLAVLITALLGSIYPAFKAIRLRPVEAMRKV